MNRTQNEKSQADLADTVAGLGVAKRLYETYEDKRCFPRVRVRCPGLIVAAGRRHSVIVHKLSPDGAQIRCDRELAATLNPGGRRIEEGAEPQVELISTLPEAHGGGVLKCRCRMWYFSLVPNNEVAFGLRFEDLSEQATATLDAFLRAALEPAAADTA